MSNGNEGRLDAIPTVWILLLSCHEKIGLLVIKPDHVGQFEKVEELWGFARRVCMEEGGDARQLL
jgi:hypothetical protein